MVLPQLVSLFANTERTNAESTGLSAWGSMVEAKIGLEIAQRGRFGSRILCPPNEVDFRLIGKSKIIDEVEPQILATVGDHLLSQSDESLEEVVIGQPIKPRQPLLQLSRVLEGRWRTV